MGSSKAADAALIERLETEVYAKLPTVHCKGLCQAACTTISMSDVEARRIRRRGVPLTASPNAADVGKPCIALTKEGRCRVYEARPTICRAYGGAVNLRCPHGCEVTPALMSDLNMFELLNIAYRIGGYRSRGKDSTLHAEFVLNLAKTDPDVRAALFRWMGSPDNMSLFLGQSAVAEAARGGRAAAGVADVFRWQQAGDIFIATPDPGPLGNIDYTEQGK